MNLDLYQNQIVEEEAKFQKRTFCPIDDTEQIL